VAACGKAELYRGLDEREANEFVVRLASYKIDAEKVLVPAERGEPTFTIAVPKDKLGQAFEVLEKYNLPKDKGHGIAAVYPGGGLIPGAFEEKAKYLLALTGEIEMTLRSIDRVVDARVHVVVPEESVLKDEDEGTVRPTASVLYKYIPDEKAELPIKDVDLKQLVARSVEGLSPTDVTVVALPVVAHVAAPAAPGPDGTPSPGPAGDFTLEQCMAKFKDEIASKDVVKMKALGPIVVREDSFTKLAGVLIGLGVLTVLFLALFLVTLFQKMSLNRKLSAAQKAAKVKKPA
jgi:type III secretion protein J